MKSTETITLSGVSSTGDASPDVIVPREIGSIRLIKEIGRGGMGVVWQGHDRLLGRDVAVKFLLQTVDDESDEHVARLLAGARAAASVDHANLTAIYHADIIESTPYLVMQLVDGVSVKDLLRRGGLELAAACDIMVQTCYAVAALHNRDVVHRDIKPSNLLIDDGGKIYVTDFGLSFDRKYAGVDTAGFAGTPPYMAPEMFEGATTLRSDVYALGISCFELLAGELPFAGDLNSLRQQHAQRELPLDKLRAKEIPQPVIDVIVRAAH